MVSSDSTDVQVAVAAALGDLARNGRLVWPAAEQATSALTTADANRANLGQKEEVIEKLVQFFKSGNPRLQQWAARAIGNLAYEHGLYPVLLSLAFLRFPSFLLTPIFTSPLLTKRQKRTEEL